ncbi:PLP-dependent aminotransferase family protein [Streptomyces sp. NPDC053493]|uniref:aminotransferase-like domain-containing protein n=1 Tax=Streptomyces sp. NPDC053493 TaxID=3365705 RepID=UPI0037D5B2DC
MDQDLGWWTRVATEGWRDRPGPRYRRIAAVLAETIERRRVGAGDRLPAERLLADALGVSRGTVVRAYDELARAGLVERRQGAGSYVRPRPGWTRTPPETSGSALLLRRLGGDADTIDLSLSVPAGTGHLPTVDGTFEVSDLDGHGMDPAGLPELRSALADHLTHRLRLPTTPDRLIVTSGAQQALALVVEALVAPQRPVVTGCPVYPGLTAAMTGRQGRLVPVPVDGLGLQIPAVERAVARLRAPLIYLDPAAHNPTGAVLGAARREALLALARRHHAVVVEDLAQAGLDLDPDLPPHVPLAAEDDSVIALGSLSKTFWAGLRIGWLRAPAPLHAYLLRLRAAHDLAPAVPAQLLATRLLRAADRAWYDELRGALRERRDLLLGLLRDQLPAWRAAVPQAGPSLWLTLPVTDTESFAHVAARYGVLVAPGATACVDGRHRDGLRLSFAESPGTLEPAVDRLTAAWEDHARHLAAVRVR